ncbi:hypothetical protein H9Q69_010266 [Fusarium xylarioides]|nr:hypothetical protein H9Q69_010266 [Fusarium xylarioides]
MPSRTYPAWFHRVRSLAQDRQARQHFRYYDHRLPTTPRDYDEDLSECSNDSEDSDESSVMGDIPENFASKEFQYYTMKEERNERKKELRKRRNGQGSNQDDNEWSEEAEIQKDLEWEEKHIAPIKEALTKAQQSSQPNYAPLKKLGPRHFKLWSTDHVKYCTFESAPITYIEFYDPRDFPALGDKINGHIYMVSYNMCSIDPFTPPRSPSLKTVPLTGNRGRHSFEVQFFDDHHLILKMPKELVFYKQAISPPPEAPDVFTYYGECEAYSTKRFLAKQRREARAERRRSASPA